MHGACNHVGGHLGEGTPDGEYIVCPCHQWKFSRQTGIGEPGFSAFRRGDDGAIYHTYSTYGRGLDSINGTYQMLDLTSKGRDESGLPWPMAWVRRHYQY